jgi:hypothetical protein
MGKPRPPKVNKENLRKAKSQTSPITKLKSRFEIFEEMRKKGELTTSYIALEAIGAIFNALQEGYSYEDLLEAYPMDWGIEQIILPSALIAPLVDGWSEYKGVDCKKSLEEVLKIKGGGQGKSSDKKKLKTKDEQRRLSREVEVLYHDAGFNSKPITIETAIQLVAEENNMSVDKVIKAHNIYKKRSRKAFKDNDIT